MSDPVLVRWNTRDTSPPEEPTSTPGWMRGGPPKIEPAPFAIPFDEQRVHVAEPEPPPVDLAPAPEPEPPPPDPGPPPPPPYDPATDPERLHAIAQMEQAATALAHARKEFAAAAEDDLIALAVTIADAILTDRLSESPQLYRMLAREAIASLDADKPVRFRVSPANYEAMVEALGGARASLAGIEVTIEHDDAIEGHGVVAEQGDAVVDARVRERLQAVRAAFAEARGARA